MEGPTKTVTLEDGSTLDARAVLIATGVSYRELQADGISALTGAGVYYGASLSEGASVRDGDVYLVGGAPMGPAAALAICLYDGEPGFYLFYCDAS